MSTIFARCLGLSGDGPIGIEGAITLLRRRTALTRAEAQVVVLDYLGRSRADLQRELGVSTDSVKTYWRRIYKKTACRSRPMLHTWVEQVIRSELADGR